MATTNYTTEQFDANYPLGLENFYWTKARNYILHKTLQRLNITDKIVEIGCGRGLVVKYLNDKGIDCTGIELSAVQTVDGINKEKIMVGQDAMTLPTDFKNQFTTLLLLDVIEHIEQPVAFVKMILRNYPNLKTIIITVPARQEIWSNYDEFFGHFCRYDLKMLDDVFEKTEFKVQRNNYFFHTLYFPALFLKAFAQKRNVQVQAPKGNMIYLHKILSWIFIAEYYLLPKSFIGSSIIGVATK